MQMQGTADQQKASEVLEKKHLQGLCGQEHITNVVSAHVLCHVCAQIFFVVLAHYA